MGCKCDVLCFLLALWHDPNSEKVMADVVKAFRRTKEVMGSSDMFLRDLLNGRTTPVPRPVRIAFGMVCVIPSENVIT